MGRPLAPLAALFLLGGGCASSPPVVVRAAQEFGCSEDQIETRDLGDGGWRAEGCGQMAVFECQPTADGSRTICVRQ